MKIKLLAVGKTDVKWVAEGLALYAARIGRYCPFAIEEIPQLKNVSALDQAEIRRREGVLILKALQEGQRLILLDERGCEKTSVEWARELEKVLRSEGRDLVFAIGGAWGFSEEVYSRAEGMISLSKMTFSHQMVRAIFAEQLYRAFTILKGEPYHHA